MRKLIIPLCFIFLFGSCSFQEATFSRENSIHVISREDGSGTRGSFTQLTHISQKNAQGETVDYTTIEAAITNSTSVVMSSVSGDVHAIGYLSLGSLNDSVNAVKIDGISPTGENIKNNTYPLARPFLLVTKETITPETEQFLAYIVSRQGQQVIEDTGYIAVEEGDEYQPSGLSGHVVIGGSSSVTPVVEKLKEAFEKIEPHMTIEVQQSDSTTGMTSTLSGVYHVGMSSRPLTPKESISLREIPIAQDGIVVIVNNDSPITQLSLDSVRRIFTGEVTLWNQILPKEDTLEKK